MRRQLVVGLVAMQHREDRSMIREDNRSNEK